MTQALATNVEDLARDLAELQMPETGGALLEGRISVDRALAQIASKRNRRMGVKQFDQWVKDSYEVLARHRYWRKRR